MTDDIIKGKIIVQAIKSYKNREEWTDIYVENNYPEAIEYMFENFDKQFGDNNSSSSNISSEAGSMLPQGARIKKLDQGERIREILKQGQYAPLPVWYQVIIIYAATKQYLLDIPVEDVLKFEKGLFEFMPKASGFT